MTEKTICPGCGEIPNEPKDEEKAYLETAKKIGLALMEIMDKGFDLTAWQCPFLDGKKGLSSDEHGHQFCAMERRFEKLEAGMRGERNVLQERAEKAEAGRNEIAKALKTLAKKESTWASDQEARLANDRGWMEKVKYQKTRAEKAEAKLGALLKAADHGGWQ